MKTALRQVQAAAKLGVSRTRVKQLMRDGKLDRVEICEGLVGVTAQSVERRLCEQTELRAKYLARKAQ